MNTENIVTSGGIFTHHFIESIRQERVGHPALKPETFTFIYQERISERELEANIADAWANLVERWDAVEREFYALDISSLRQRWLRPLFTSLSYKLEYNKGDIVLEDDFRFPISHMGWCGTSSAAIPIHTVLYQDDNTLETKAQPGRGIKAMSPHDMLQRYLNLSKDHKWGIVSDGVVLRLERDFYHTYTRGYTEFDLQGIFSTRDFASFRALYRLLHASRFVIPEGGENAPIDDLYEDALSQGVDVGNKLRENVQAAIESLGNGFLISAPGFLDKVRELADGPQQLYHDILITIYRVLFLLFAEQRGMLPGRGSLYNEEFSLTAFRTLAEQPRSEDKNFDLWEKLKTTFSMVEHGVKDLDIFPYNGALFSMGRTPLLTPAKDDGSPRCQNDHLLTTIRHLTTVMKDGVTQRISYSDLSVEEIGSIYESLLEITPTISDSVVTVDNREIPPNTFYLDPGGKGRKTTGSYYTPPSLVNELIKSALEPVMLARLKDAVPGYETDMVEALTDDECDLLEEALLKIKVVDPAAGSGAFLIAANNKLGLELARIRSKSYFPPEAILQHARRDVLADCIHGVDLNPMAVELCKVSLWINAAVEDAPLNFLDHHIQCGNSLVGATPELIKRGIPDEAYDPVTGDDKALARSYKQRNRQERQGQQGFAFKVTEISDHAALQKWLKARNLSETEPAAAEKAFIEYQSSQEKWDERLPYDLWTAAFFMPVQKGQLIPTSQHVRQAKADPKLVPSEMKMAVRELAEEQRFLHWHLSFPEVFDKDGKGGFDVVLGNPPWEMINLEEKEFFEGRDEDIVNASTGAQRKKLIEKLRTTNAGLFIEYKVALHDADALSKFLRNSNKYPLTSNGRINLFSVFAGLDKQLISIIGRCGVIVPSGIATDYSNRDFFGSLIENNQVISFFDFENRKGLFLEVHRSYKFCLFTIRGPQENEFTDGEFAFFLQSTEEINDEEKKFTLSPKDFELLNPNTNTCPIFRSRADAALSKKLYKQATIIVNEQTDANPWGASFKQGFFNMTSDSQLFQTKEQMEKLGFELHGNVYTNGEETYLPLYEAKMFWHFDHRFGTFKDVVSRTNTHLPMVYPKTHQSLPHPWYWVNASHCENVIGNWNYDWFLGFRRISNASNERTFVATILPNSPSGDNIFLILPSEATTVSALFLLLNLCSFTFDYIVRQKMGGMNLNFFIVKQLPVLSPDIANNLTNYYLPKALELIYTSDDLLGLANNLWQECTYFEKEQIINQYNLHLNSDDAKSERDITTNKINLIETDNRFPIHPYSWNENRRFQLRCDLDALFGHLYNLTRDEFEYILETFPIVKRNDETEYGEYRTKRVILEKFDAMADDPMLEGVCIPLAERVSVLKDRPKTQSEPTPQKQPAKPVTLPKSEYKQPTPKVVREAQIKDQNQPDLFNSNASESNEPPSGPSDYTLYKCPLCDKHILGFALDEHTRDVHGGEDPGYQKVGK